MSDPVPPFLVFAASIGIVALVLHASLWRARLPGVREWAACAALISVSVLLPLPHRQVAAPFALVLAGLAGAASLACFYAGCQRLAGVQPNRPVLAGAVVALGLVLGGVAVGGGGQPAMALANSVFAVVFGASIAWRLLRPAPTADIVRPRRVTAGLALLMGLCAVFDGAACTAHVRVPMLFCIAEVAAAMLPLAALMLVHDTLLRRASDSTDGDALTGLPSRKQFEAAVRDCLADPRTVHPVALLVLELDRFDRINDTVGSAGGDAVLRDFAQLAGAQLRADTLVGRIGSETFGVFLPGTAARAAWQAGERLRAAAASRTVATPGGDCVYTVSGGIAAAEDGDTFERLYVRADLALYEARQTGRDVIRVAHSALAGSAPGA
ncbi:GGDEF domain-containing protein [Burkholderia sp. 22PA0106]|uniref:GGDEF domain-containing protein n=1 Tax=Burkholderia sp. 22PA0106 TaxID=3237371 RepID=UPI0039C104D3